MEARVFGRKNYEEIPPCFVLNVICIIPSHLHNTHIWGQFLPIFVCLTPRGAQYIGLPPTVFNSEEIPSWFVMNVFLWLLYTIQWFKLGIYLHTTHIWGHLWSKFGYLTPGVPIYIGLSPTVSPLIMKKYHHALSWMYVWLLCINKWSK